MKTVEGLDSRICINSTRQYPWPATFLAINDEECCECGHCVVTVDGKEYDHEAYKNLLIDTATLKPAPSKVESGQPEESQEVMWKEIIAYLAQQSILRKGWTEMFAVIADQYTITRKP